MLTEMVEYGGKIEERVKAMKNELKENVQGTNSDGKETGTQFNGLDQKEEIIIQPEQNEERRIWKNEERFRNLWDNFKCPNIQIIRVPGEEEEQEIENLFEKIMKENFLNLAKEIDIQEVQEVQRLPKKLYPRKHTPGHIILSLCKIKDKERILKGAREKGDSYLQSSAHKTISWSLKSNITCKKGLESIPSHERQGPTSKIAVSSKAII